MMKRTNEGQSERRIVNIGVGRLAMKFVDSPPPNKNVVLTGFAISAPSADSAEILAWNLSPVVGEEFLSCLDGGVEANLFRAWRK